MSDKIKNTLLATKANKIDKKCKFSMEEVKYISKIGTSSMNPTYEDILRAQSMKSDKIRKTSLVYSPTFSLLTESANSLKSS